MRDDIDTLGHRQAAGLIDKTGRFAAGRHSLDGHDGRDNGADFLGREYFYGGAVRKKLHDEP